jgi:hypothetical protein
MRVQNATPSLADLAADLGVLLKEGDRRHRAAAVRACRPHRSGCQRAHELARRAGRGAQGGIVRQA